MGIRGMNYIVLAPSVMLTDAVSRFVNDSRMHILRDDRGTLVAYESTFTPLSARQFLGEYSTVDLEEEVAIQRFLASVPRDLYFMKRAGDECNSRGNWLNHGFHKEKKVRAVDDEFDRLVAIA